MKTPIHYDSVADFCRQYKITELALFGVTFAPDTHYGLFDPVQLQEKLRPVFGREVDLVERAGLRNPFRRHYILNNMKVLYAS